MSHELPATSPDQAARAPLAMRDPVASALRDGVLQDLIAVSMVVAAAEERAAGPDGPAPAALLGDARRTLQADVERLRAVITELEREAPRPAGRRGRGVLAALPALRQAVDPVRRWGRGRAARGQSAASTPERNTMRSTSVGSAASASA